MTDVLKVLALTSDGSVFGALKAFLADFDLDEFVDTLRHISNQGAVSLFLHGLLF